MFIEEKNKEIVRRLYNEVIAQRTVSTRTGFGRNAFTQYTSSSRPSSLNTFRLFFSGVRNAFPDFNMKLESMLVKGDRVLVRYRIQGTHRGEFMGISPTNETMTICGIDVFRIDNGKIVEHWDAAHQLEALPQKEKMTVFQSVSDSWGNSKLTVNRYNPKQISLRT
jgi:predicted ester cyclase